jgi:hypothetical protein
LFSLIEDFRACQALVDVVLDGYIIGVLAPDIGAYIDELSDRLSDFETAIITGCGRMDETDLTRTSSCLCNTA